MISGCSHSSRKRTTPANRTNRAITPGANLPIPMAVPASRADSLPLRGRAQPLRRSRRRHSPGAAPASPSDAGTAFPRPDLRFRHPAGCYLVTGAVLKPTMSGNSRTSVQVRDSAGTGLSGIYPGAPTAGLAPGLILTNANFSTQHSNGVTFYILEAYQILDLGSEQAA